MRSLLFLGFLLSACSPSSSAPDINGTYKATLARTTCSKALETKSGTVKIVDTMAAHTATISGPYDCTLTFDITDYGGVGEVRSADPSCTERPMGFELSAPNDFSPGHISLAWAQAGAGDGGADGGPGSCVIHDEWDLTKQ